MVLLISPTRRGRFRRYVPLRWLHRVRPRDSDVHRGEEECARGYHDRADGGYHRCLFDPRGHSRLVAQTSECTFSAISKPILATEGLFCSSSWDLQGLHTFFAPLQTWHLQFFVQFRKCSVTFPDFFKVSLTLCFSSKLQQHCSNFSKRSRKLERHFANLMEKR